MPSNPIGTTTRVDQWSYQQNYVERQMDNSAYTAAHPNNTLILAGPARKPKFAPGTAIKSFADTMSPMGMMQQLQVGQQKPLQPMMAIGSGRGFFTSGKAQTTWSMARLEVNGRNLLRALYTSAVRNGLDVSKFGDSPVESDQYEQSWLNLDSELFYIPIGLAILVRSPLNSTVQAMYLEVCMISSWSVGFAAGQTAIMENVSGMAERLRPIAPNEFSGLSDGQISADNASLLATGMGMPAEDPEGLQDW